MHGTPLCTQARTRVVDRATSSPPEQAQRVNSMRRGTGLTVHAASEARCSTQLPIGQGSELLQPLLLCSNLHCSRCTPHALPHHAADQPCLYDLCHVCASHSIAQRRQPAWTSSAPSSAASCRPAQQPSQLQQLATTRPPRWRLRQTSSASWTQSGSRLAMSSTAWCAWQRWPVQVAQLTSCGPGAMPGAKRASSTTLGSCDLTAPPIPF
jgi:hypothetical protein